MSVSEAVSGAAFGAALVCAGVYAPDVIRAQMTFSSNAMLAVMMGASATSAVVFDVAHRWSVVPKVHRAAAEIGFFPYDGNVVGGALIGIGMAVTGACPGTVMVQAGMGMPTGVLVGVGGIAGGLAFVRLQPWLRRRKALADSQGRTAAAGFERPRDIAAKLGVSPLFLLLVWVPLCLTALGLFLGMDDTLWRPLPSGLVSPVQGGFLIGTAQLVTILLTHHALGASAAFEDVGRWLEQKVFRGSSSSGGKSHLLTPSVAFSVGMISAAASLQSTSVIRTRNASTPQMLDGSVATSCLLGGLAMVIGARIAGGCTSGHGISGLAKFSLSSLVTTAAMFSAGILTAFVMGL